MAGSLPSPQLLTQAPTDNSNLGATTSFVKTAVPFVNVFSYLSAAQVADVVSNTGALDCTAAIASAYADSKSLIFPAGTYKVSSLPNFAVFGTRIIGVGTVVINYTGSTIGLSVDAGSTPGVFVQNITIENMTINAANVATTAFFVRGITHSTFKNIRMRNFTTVGLLCNSYVSCYFENIYLTGNEPGVTTITATGIQLDKRGTGEQSSNGTFINPVIEGVSGVGISLVDAAMNTFIGGSSEGNGTGVNIAAASLNNSIIGLDMEANTADVACAGLRNKFINCLSTTAFNITAGTSNHAFGGQMHDITISGGVGAILSCVGYSGTLTDSGTNTSKFANYYITGASVDASVLPTGVSFTNGGSVLKNYIESGTWTVTPSGLTVVGTPTYTGKYTRIGNVVHFSVRFQSTTSTASAGGAGTSFNLPVSCNSNGATCSAGNNGTASAYGNGAIYAVTCYPPAWTATADVVVSGTYLV